MSEAGWWRHLRGDPSRFLLDDAEPGVTWRTLIELLGRPPDSPAVHRARAEARTRGATVALLEQQSALGTWGSPTGYAAHWGGTAWQLAALAQLGADPEDRRVQAGVEALLEVLQPHAGGFATGKGSAPSACFTAEICAALVRFGRSHQPRVREAIAWLAEGSDGWSCPEARHGAGGCAVAAVAVLRLIAELPAEQRRRLDALRDRAAGWLRSHRLFLAADGPRGWLELAHPCIGRTDLLGAVYALARAGVEADDATREALALLLARQDEQGRLHQEHHAAFGEEAGQPSRWLTLKALVALAAYGDAM